MYKNLDIDDNLKKVLAENYPNIDDLINEENKSTSSDKWQSDKSVLLELSKLSKFSKSHERFKQIISGDYSNIDDSINEENKSTSSDNLMLFSNLSLTKDSELGNQHC
ncbi:17309_t:CDS:2 [Dentiscutata erythropus]|uniref:17309_t:CDS:1 n=1 Tax=Dentiscutata erythropus TaxID=1348616 RepID=A0A9N9CN86_9GLOM|nr:17309_t:CDS:2 [Dentiscutata erythropus]